LPENTSVSIVIPSKDNKSYLSKCVSSIIEKSSFADYEIIVVDNGSTAAETLDYFENISRSPKIRVIRKPIPFNFSALCNFGAAEASGDAIIFLNDDTEVIDADWMQRLAAHSLLPYVGCVGAKLLYGHDGSVQHNGILNLADGPGHAFVGRHVNDPGYFARNLLDGNWLAVTAACLAIERKKFEAVGGFDEDLGVAYNDVELGFRLYEAGFYNVCCASVHLTHHESVSRGVDHISPEKMKRLRKEKEYLYSKHPRFYMNDPFFNINLHPNDPQFDLKNVWSGER
jgi:GT2 family glycosyltransferase